MYIYVWTHMRVICVYFMDLNAHTLRTCVYINALLDIHMCTPCHIRYYNDLFVATHTHAHGALLQRFLCFNVYTCTPRCMWTHAHRVACGVVNIMSHLVTSRIYRVAKTHRIPFLYRSFSAKVTHIVLAFLWKMICNQVILWVFATLYKVYCLFLFSFFFPRKAETNKRAHLHK